MYCVSYGCKTWFVNLREAQGLRVFENGVLWRMFRRKMEEITGEE